MYGTPNGERVLAGAEARLFRYGLQQLVDELADWDGYATSGVPAFDQLSIGQRLTGLYLAAAALLEEQGPLLPRSQSIEAAVAAVYQLLADYVVMEAITDDDRPWSVRILIHEALREAGIAQIHDPRCRDADQWELYVDCLQDLVQFDEDFDHVCDMPAGLQSTADSHLEFAPIYFSQVLDDPTDGELPGLVEKLRRFGE